MTPLQQHEEEKQFVASKIPQPNCTISSTGIPKEIQQQSGLLTRTPLQQLIASNLPQQNSTITSVTMPKQTQPESGPSTRTPLEQFQAKHDFLAADTDQKLLEKCMMNLSEDEIDSEHEIPLNGKENNGKDISTASNSSKRKRSYSFFFI